MNRLVRWGGGLGLLLGVLVGLFACGGRDETTVGSRISPVRHDGGFFSLEVPRGWTLVTAGACSEFAFHAYDPENRMRQVFYFGQAGPVYTNGAQRVIDQAYAAMGGYPTPWLDVPVVQPLTPETFVEQFPALLSSSVAAAFMPDAPRLDEVRIVSSSARTSPIQGGSCATVRAIYRIEGRIGEALFSVTVAPLMPFTGGPGGSTGMGFMICGVTAEKEAFGGVVDDLVHSLESFTVDESYARQCIAQQNQTYQGILSAGQTLRETSDLIMDGWQERTETHDILAERWSDTIRSTERLYDPDTRDVYEFENGFYETYDLHRSQYRLDELQPLPDDDYELWMTPPLDGPQNLE